MGIYISELDFQRFGVKTAQGRVKKETEIAELAAFCSANEVDLAIVRASSQDLALVHSLEAEGYRLMDCLLYYVFNFDKKFIPNDVWQHPIRRLVAADETSLMAIAEESFKGYFGHYHADPRLPKEKCNEVYIDWARNSLLKKELGHYVIGVAAEGRLNSFLSFKVNDTEEVEVMLSGILQVSQGRGIHQALMRYAVAWAQEFGAKRTIVSTQVTNAASQKAWTRIGFEVYQAYYTLHKWF